MVSAPRSRSNVAIDQALYNDMWAKTARQDLLETLRTLTVLAVENEPKFRRITRIAQCMLSLSRLSDVCDTAPRSDVPTSPPSNTGFETIRHDISNGPSEVNAPRRSARIAANAEKRQRQPSSSSPADSPNQAVAASYVTRSNVPRKRKRSTKTTTQRTKNEERKVASHACVGDGKWIKPMARCHLGPRNV